MDLLGYAALGGLERLTIVAGAVIIGYWGYRLYTAEKSAGLIFMGLSVLVLVGALLAVPLLLGGCVTATVQQVREQVGPGFPVAVKLNSADFQKGGFGFEESLLVAQWLEQAGVDAVITGKPSTEFFHQVLASASAQPSQALMVGDDVFGDIEGAINAGIPACLVRTGKYRPGDEHRIAGEFKVVDSVVEAVEIALS